MLQLDVNNRYNVRAYGVRTVAGNRWRDWRHPGGADGERPLAVVIGGRTLCGRGYVFSPREMDSIIAEAGLRIVERVVIDYQTGQVRRTPCEGQLFYRLVRGNRGSLAD